jgi:beta-glucanase (GH16 family)
MSTPGHSPLGKIASRSFPALRNRNIVRGASFVFISSLALGYSLVPAPAFASKPTLSIESSQANDVVYIKGANFPSRATATVETLLGGAKQERKVEVKDGGFKLAFIRRAADTRDLVTAKAWTKDRRATAKRTVEPASTPPVNETFAPTTAAPATTAPPAAPAPAAETQAPTTPTPPTTGAKKSSPATTAKPAAAAAAKPASSGGGNGGAPAGYKMVWNDEFEGAALNESKWGLYEGAGNAGVGKRVTSAVSVGDGELKITGNGMNGGGLATDYNATYGYYEVRQRFDKNSIGYNTATLLWPKSGKWPVDGEIDIAEIFNGDTTECGSYVHWGADNKQLYNEYKGDFSQWHTWGVEWRPDGLTYYLDGKAFWNVTQAEAVPHNAHFLALQLDVNENTNKANGSTFHVDYVRVYQK